MTDPGAGEKTGDMSDRCDAVHPDHPGMRCDLAGATQGLATILPSHPHAAGRHVGAMLGHPMGHPDCTLGQPDRRCQCVKLAGHGPQCCAAMDEEDLLCAACREWCTLPLPAVPHPGRVRDD